MTQINPQDTQREATLRFLAQPKDVNFGGNVHGGMAMKWLDEAGYVCATAWSGKYCVTVFAGDINFHHPIPVGDLVEVKAKIIHTGKTSMHILVELQSSNPKGSAPIKAIHCIMVFVAIDDKGKPTPVPSWQPTSTEDLKLESYAKRIMDMRNTNQQA